jgi:DNA-binding CsgD family transcriptional regulator
MRDAGSLPLTHRQRELIEALSRNGDYQATAAELGISVKALHRRIDRIKNKVSQTGKI